MIVATQHEIDLHPRVVDGVAEKEGRAAVGARDDEIADVVAGKPLRSVDAVLEENCASHGHAEPKRAGPTLAASAVNLVIGKRGAGPGVTRRTTGRELSASREAELFGRAEAWIDPTGFTQCRNRRLVDCAALALQVRRMRAAPVRTLVPVETQPSQIAQHPLDERRLVAGGVGVLDTQHEMAIATARSKVAEHRRPRVAEMQMTGRAGREPRNG